jgi:hypothetical protein
MEKLFLANIFCEPGGCNPDRIKNIDKPRIGYLVVVCSEYLSQEVVTLWLFVASILAKKWLPCGCL